MVPLSSAGRQHLDAVAVAVVRVQPDVAGEGVALAPVDLEADAAQPGGDLVDVGDDERRVGLAGRGEGVSTPTCSSAVTLPWSSYARNQAPPRATRSAGLSTSVMPSPSA